MERIKRRYCLYFNQNLAKLWDDILEIIKDNKDAESIENDFTEHYAFFFYKLHAYSEEVKVPKRAKSCSILLINRAL